jgi:acetylornithine/LysW-gamma-L-lysine aminotransferase
MSAADPAALELAHLLPVFAKRPVTIVRGENARLWDDRGREYLDCVSAHGVSNLGHGHPHVVAAVREQAGRLIALSNAFANDRRAELAATLARIAPRGLDRAFFCNSGAEAVEAALKFARFSTGRSGFVCAMRAFHGRTFGALSATFRKEYREPFAPLVPGFAFAPYNDLAKFAALIGDDTAAVILEPIQGEAGVHLGDPEFFQGVRRLCDERGALLIFDEVQTGFCRTGAWFAGERLGVIPDLLCLAKAIAGGLPMGATLCNERVQAPTGRHGTTFGGNPLCCAAALATIQVMEQERLAARAARLGDRLVGALRAAAPAKVREIRHAGLMIGIEVREKAAPLIGELLEHGLLTFPAGSTTIRVYPPLTIEEPLVDEIAARLLRVLA